MSGRSLFVRLTEDPRILNEAWEEVHRNAKSLSKGIDNIRLDKYAEHSQRNLTQLRLELKKGEFKFSQLKASALPKPNGEYRPIQIATIKDRVVQKAIELLIRKQLNEKYNLFNNPVSYAYIKTDDITDYDPANPQTFKGVRGALERVKFFNEAGYVWSLKSDIIDYFPSVNKDKLLNELIFPVLSPDESLNELIKEAFTQEITIAAATRKLFSKEKLDKFLSNNGLPQGSILSPLFSNVYLTDFDNVMSEKGYILIRYVDDFIIMTKTKSEALKSAKDALKELEKIGLKIHPVGESKTSVQQNTDITFLGIRFKNGKFYPSKQAFAKNIEKLKLYPKYSSLTKEFQSIQMVSRAWGSTYFFCDNDPEEYQKLDDELVLAVERVLKKARLKPINKLKNRELRRLGISLFSSSVVRAKDRNITKLKELKK